MHWQFPISIREHATRFTAAAARGGAVPALVLVGCGLVTGSVLCAR
jgi:hypothetical protein